MKGKQLVGGSELFTTAHLIHFIIKVLQFEYKKLAEVKRFEKNKLILFKL